MIGLAQKSRRAVPKDLEGRYEKHRGIHVLRVSGDDYEIGYQHGALLAHVVGRGPLPELATYLEKTLAREVGPMFGRGAARVLQNTVGRMVSSKIPKHVNETFEGLADGARLSKEMLHRAVTMPDTFLWLVKQARGRMAPVAPRLGVPVMGCTSAMAWGEATTDGAMLHGRNFDYPAVSTWDREQAVVFHRPKVGQRYVSCAAPGIVLGGITAMNASGLSLVVHQHMGCDLIKLGGVPIGIAGDQVMRFAENLDDAKRILDAHPPSGCWTYVIGSADESRILCYEATPDVSDALYVDTGTFGYSNTFLSTKLADHERLAYPTHWRNVAERYHGATELLESKKGGIDADHIAKILGHTGDDACRFSKAISTLMTVTSVVFRPTDRTFWLGLGPAPTSNRPFVPFSLELEGPGEMPDLVGGILKDENAAAAFDVYRDGYEAYFIHGNTEAALRHVARARTMKPDEPIYAFVEGLLALSLKQNSEAEAAFTRAIELGHAVPQRLAAFHLWRGRVRDQLGRRSDALADYERTSQGDEGLRKQAARHRAKPWTWRRFGVDMMYADAA